MRKWCRCRQEGSPSMSCRARRTLSGSGGDVVDCHAEAVNTLTVKCRVVHLDSSAERVIDHPAACHYNLVRMRQRDEQQLKQKNNNIIFRMLNAFLTIISKFKESSLSQYNNPYL